MPANRNNTKLKVSAQESDSNNSPQNNYHDYQHLRKTFNDSHAAGKSFKIQLSNSGGIDAILPRLANRAPDDQFIHQ